MKNYKTKFFIFIASITIGFLIIINVGVSNTSKFLSLNSMEYMDASEERSKLFDEIANLKEDNYELSKKINSYDFDENGSEKIVEHMKSQLDDYSIVAGSTTVSGPGIILRINDAYFDIYDNSQFEINRSILHAADVALVLNELRSAGAEAISLNSYSTIYKKPLGVSERTEALVDLGLKSYRIINTTGVECAWAFIEFEDKIKIEGPFSFYAIGDPDQLEEAIFSEGSHINKLIIRNLDIKVEKVENITIPQSKKSMFPKYMQRADS